MQKSYIVYITDSSMYLYRSQRKRLNFETEYKCEDGQDVSTLCKLLEARRSYSIYVYLDTTEVYFEHKSFKDITQHEASKAMHNYTLRSNHLIAGIAKLEPFQQQTTSKARRRGKRRKLSDKQQYSCAIFLILAEFASKAIKTFIHFISYGNNNIASVRFLPMVITQCKPISPQYGVTINIRINNGGRVATVVSYSGNFIINREENIDLSNQNSLKEDIESTILYIETTLAGQLNFNINIMTEVELDHETIQFHSTAIKVQVITISNMRDMHRVKITQNSPYPLNDNVIALMTQIKSLDHAMTNVALSKKKCLLLVTKVLHRVTRVAALCIILFQVQMILRNVVRHWQKIYHVRSSILEERKQLEEQAKDKIDDSILQQAKAIIANKKIDEYQFDCINFITPMSTIISQEPYVKVKNYDWQCISACDSPKPNIALEMNITLKSPTLPAMSIQAMLDKFNTALLRSYGTTYTVNVLPIKVDNNNASTYSTKISITSKNT